MRLSILALGLLVASSAFAAETRQVSCQGYGEEYVIAMSGEQVTAVTHYYYDHGQVSSKSKLGIDEYAVKSDVGNLVLRDGRATVTLTLKFKAGTQQPFLGAYDYFERDGDQISRSKGKLQCSFDLI